MQIITRIKNLSLESGLEKYINEKIGALEKLLRLCHGEKEWKAIKDTCEVFVEVEKETMHHKKGHIFRARAHMRLPGEGLEAEAEADTAKVAIDLLKDEFYNEVKKYKTKKMAIDRRRQRAAKKEFHLSPEARSYRKGRILDEGA